MHVQPRLIVHRLTRTHEGDPVERSRRAADVLDERASDVVEHILDRRIGRQIRQTLLRRRKAARHIQTVIPVSGPRVHRRQIILLCHNRGDDCIHRIPYICHLHRPIFPEMKEEPINSAIP